MMYMDEDEVIHDGILPDDELEGLEEEGETF